MVKAESACPGRRISGPAKRHNSSSRRTHHAARLEQVAEADESCTYIIVGSERVVLVDGSSSAYDLPWVDSF